MDITLTNHPSQLHINGKPQFEDDGSPMPMFPYARAVRVDGLIVGYVEIDDPCKPINLNVGPAKLPQHVKDKIETEVRKQLGHKGSMTQVRDRLKRIDDDDIYEE